MLRTTIIRSSRRTFTTTARVRKIIPEATQTTPGKQPNNMDGDSTAKTMDKGANSAMGNTEMTQGIHESNHQATPAGEKTQGTGTSAFHKDGAIGSAFKADGAIGGTADKVGGPFAKDGMIGKNFNPDGAVGGTVQENLGKKE